MNKKNNKINVRTFPFSKNVLWKISSDGDVVPKIHYSSWKKLFRNLEKRILCPGFLLESVVCAFAYNRLKNETTKKIDFVIPNYYLKGMSYFCNMNFLEYKEYKEYEDVVDEFFRLTKAVDNYTTPIFFDKNNNVYFNMLNNYGFLGGVSRYRKYCIRRNEKPFWQQILNNLCLPYNENLFYIENLLPLETTYKKYIVKLGLQNNSKYIIFDITNFLNLTADDRDIQSITLFKHQVLEICGQLKLKDFDVLLMVNDEKEYKDLGINNVIPSWSNIPSEIIISLLYGSYGIISSDQNLYLLGAILGVKNILALDKKQIGFSFDDIDCFLLNTKIKKHNWNYFDIINDSVSNIAKYIK